MKSVWDQQGRAGEDAEVVVRIRECSVGLSVTVFSFWSKWILGGRVVPTEFWESLDYTQRKECIMSFFKKPPANVQGKGEGPDPIDDKMKKNYPTLWEYLSCSSWPDGEERKRSSLVMFCQDGMVKACLSDKNFNVQLWAASASFLGALEAMEGRLTEDKPEWRAEKKKAK